MKLFDANLSVLYESCDLKRINYETFETILNDFTYIIERQYKIKLNFIFNYTLSCNVNSMIDIMMDESNEELTVVINYSFIRKDILAITNIPNIISHTLYNLVFYISTNVSIILSQHMNDDFDHSDDYFDKVYNIFKNLVLERLMRLKDDNGELFNVVVNHQLSCIGTSQFIS